MLVVLCRCLVPNLVAIVVVLVVVGVLVVVVVVVVLVGVVVVARVAGRARQNVSYIPVFFVFSSY